MSATIKQLICIPCGHRWYPVRPLEPKLCPVCKRANWKTGKGPSTIKARLRAEKPIE